MKIELIKQELTFIFGDQLKDYLGNEMNLCDEQTIRAKFNEYVKNNLTKIKIKDLIDNHQNSYILINTPDGYNEVSDFYIKSPRKIYKITTVDNYYTKCANTHKLETLDGWKYAQDISKNDSILTKEGYRKVKNIKIYKKEEHVYDIEVLHENHRYWSGNGLSSHNTGKTYLACSIVRNAQAMDYFPVYYDSEGSIDVDFVKRLGIDPTKFRIEHVGTVEEFTTLAANLNETVSEIKKAGKVPPKIMVVLDSLGSLSSTKEKADAISGSDKRDMTKQQAIRKTFRVIGNDFAKNGIPFIVCNHVYACLVGNTKVYIDANEYKELKDIQKGEYVMTLDGPKEVIDKFEFTPKKLLELKFEDNYVVKCTSEHKFAVEKNNEIVWVKAEDLDENDEILLL